MGVDDDAGGRETRVAGSLVGLLGLLLAAVQVHHLLALDDPVRILVESVVPLSLACVLVVLGVAVATGRVVENPDAHRFAGWIAGGAAIFLLTGVWILALDVVLGYATPERVVITTSAVTLGAIVGAVVGLYDARTREQTRRLRQRERRLTRRNRHLDDFVSVVSHDLRNPLSVAVGRTELAREECDSDHLESVVRAHDRMEALIDDLLTLARQEDERIDAETIDLATVARQSWRSVDTTAGELLVHTDRTIRADESQLTRLFENLFRNSVEHGSTGNRTESGDSVEHGSTGSRQAAGDRADSGPTTGQPAVEEALENGGTTVTVVVGDCEGGFYVEDDGPGIPADERERIFESGYSTTSDGTGFGLAIVRGIVDTHGWTIDVTDADSGGARFEVTGVDTGE